MLVEGIWTKCDCGLQHLLRSWSLSKLLPFMISSLLLTVGHRPAFGIRGGSGMFVSMGIWCLSVARRINHRLFKHNFQLCFSNFQLRDKMENPTPPCWPECQPFHPETISPSLMSTVNISNQGLGLCHMGCLWLVTQHSVVWVDLVQSIRIAESCLGRVKCLPPVRQTVHAQPRRKLKESPLPLHVLTTRLSSRCLTKMICF